MQRFVPDFSENQQQSLFVRALKFAQWFALISGLVSLIEAAIIAALLR